MINVAYCVDMYVQINSTEYEEASIGRLIVVIVGSYEGAWGAGATVPRIVHVRWSFP